MHKLKVNRKFLSQLELRDEPLQELGRRVSESGFILPGHGLKGKHITTTTDNDLSVMYEEYCSKRCEIRLWCMCIMNENSDYERKQSYEKEESEPPLSAKRGTCQQRMEQVDGTLREKHGDIYSVEKLNAWAHLIHMGKHSSYANPPNLPYFKKPCKESTVSEQQDIETQSTSSLSPMKRIQLRSECIDQLTKLHTLLEKGGVPGEQYDSLKKAILGDIQNFQ